MRSLASKSPRSMRRASSISSSAVSRRCRLTSLRNSCRESISGMVGCATEFVLPVGSERNRELDLHYDARMPALSPPVLPQLALSRVALPEGEEWAYEPKWDGFRAIAFV